MIDLRSRSMHRRLFSYQVRASPASKIVPQKEKLQDDLHSAGPETKATRASVPADAEWLGITFQLGTFMPDLLPIRLLDRHDVNLSEATEKSFES